MVLMVMVLVLLVGASNVLAGRCGAGGSIHVELGAGVLSRVTCLSVGVLLPISLSATERLDWPIVFNQS